MKYEEYAEMFSLAFSDDRDEVRFAELKKKYSKDSDANTMGSDYVWLPLEFEEPSEAHPDGMVSIDWYDEWKLEDWE